MIAASPNIPKVNLDLVARPRPLLDRYCPGSGGQDHFCIAGDHCEAIVQLYDRVYVECNWPLRLSRGGGGGVR
jgi:hypothetical protein